MKHEDVVLLILGLNSPISSWRHRVGVITLRNMHTIEKSAASFKYAVSHSIWNHRLLSLLLHVVVNQMQLTRYKLRWTMQPRREFHHDKMRFLRHQIGSHRCINLINLGIIGGSMIQEKVNRTKFQKQTSASGLTALAQLDAKENFRKARLSTEMILHRRQVRFYIISGRLDWANCPI